MALASIDIEQLTRENARLRTELDSERAARKQAEARADQAEANSAMWEKRARSEREMHERSDERTRAMTSVVMNITMDEVDRVAILVAGIVTESEFQQKEAKGEADPYWRPNPMALIAARSGMSTDTLRKSQKRQQAAGLIGRRVAKIRDPENPEDVTKIRSQAMVNREPDLNQHWFQAGALDMNAALPDRKHQGGARTPNMDRHCIKCGSENTTIRCKDCGHSVITLSLPEVKQARKVEARKAVEDRANQQDATSREEGVKLQVAALRDVSTSGDSTPTPGYCGVTPQEPQVATSPLPQSFDPDILTPEPVEVAWWEIGQ